MLPRSRRRRPRKCTLLLAPNKRRIAFSSTVLPEQQPPFHSLILTLLGCEGEVLGVCCPGAQQGGDVRDLIGSVVVAVPDLLVLPTSTLHPHALVSRVQCLKVGQLERNAVGVPESLDVRAYCVDGKAVEDGGKLTYSGIRCASSPLPQVEVQREDQLSLAQGGLRPVIARHYGRLTPEWKARWSEAIAAVRSNVPLGWAAMRELPATYHPLRIFLDSNVLQCLQDYGGCIFEHESFVRCGRSGASREDVSALQGIALFIQRDAFEFALSERSLQEVVDRRDPRYLQWAFDVLDHWEACIEHVGSPFRGTALQSAEELDRREFNYVSVKDRALLRDALALECDTFLTLERKLPRHAEHLSRKLAIEVVRPPELWQRLQPHLRGL